MRNEIEWLFFDVGSTLVDESEAYRHRIRDAVAGTSVTYQQFHDTMLAYYRQGGKGDKLAAAHFGLALPPWHTEDERLYPDAAVCLEKLAAHYRIGVIANQQAGTRDRLRAFGILPCIELVVASAEEGVSKPDPAIFRIALERAHCAPAQAAMIGDRLDNDIAPANRLGMMTVRLLRSFGRYAAPQSDEERPDAEADDLMAVCDLFLREKHESRRIFHISKHDA